MKRILLLFIALVTFNSVSAQKTEQLPIYRVNAYVHNTYGDVTILQTKDSKISYEVAADSTLKKSKEYVFWLEITDEHDAQTKKAAIVRKVFTTYQVQRDQESVSKDLSNRKIIRQ